MNIFYFVTFNLLISGGGGGVPCPYILFNFCFGPMGMGLKTVGQMGLKTVKTPVMTKINIIVFAVL